MSDKDKNYQEIVGLFHSPEKLEDAISALTSAGWHRAELSLLAQHHVLQPEHVEQDTAELADDPKADRQAPVSEVDVRQGRTLAGGLSGVVAALLASGATIMSGGGTLMAVLGAAVAGGGAAGLVEALGRRAGSERERFLMEQAEKDGILLWAKIEDPEEEHKAREIFESAGATDIHVHEGTHG